MPGTGVAAPTVASLGENSRMYVGGNLGAQQAAGGNWVRFVQGMVTAGGAVSDVADNMSEGFTEKSRGGRNCMIRADCIWRAADNPLAFPPRFIILDLTPRIILWPDFLNDLNQYIKLPIGFCEGFDLAIAGQGEARVGFTVTLSNHGKFYDFNRKDPLGVFA